MYITYCTTSKVLGDRFYFNEAEFIASLYISDI